MSASDDRPSLLYPSQRLREVVEPIEAQYAQILRRESCHWLYESTLAKYFQTKNNPLPLTSILPRPPQFQDVDWQIEGEPEWKIDESRGQQLIYTRRGTSLTDRIREVQYELGRSDGEYPYVAKLELVRGTHQLIVLQEYRLELLQSEELFFTASRMKDELRWREHRHWLNKPLVVREVQMQSGPVSVPDFVDHQARFYLEYMSKLRAQTTTPPSENLRESDDQAHQANLDRQRRRLKRQLDLEIERVRTISSYLEETVSTLPIDEDEKARLIRELRLKFSEEGEQNNDDVEILG